MDTDSQNECLALHALRSVHLRVPGDLCVRGIRLRAAGFGVEVQRDQQGVGADIQDAHPSLHAFVCSAEIGLIINITV